MKKSVRNLTDFIKKANEIHNFKYGYINSIYDGCHVKLIINCPVEDHGDFPQTASCHLSGRGCPKCAGRYRTTDEFIKMANKVHGTRYEYEKFLYLGTLKKGIITCKTHGDFPQTPNSHLRGEGCPYCDDDKRRWTIQKFIKEANKIHSNKYDYSLFDYKSCKIKGIIICHEKDVNDQEHGQFQQDAVHHLVGKGCPKCAKEKSGLYSLQFFKKFPNIKNNPGKLYLIKFIDENQTFYKIGMTKNTIQKRFEVATQFYKIEELLVFENTLFNVFNIEQKMLKEIRKTQASPKNTILKNNGESECFYAEDDFIKKLIVKIKTFLTS